MSTVIVEILKAALALTGALVGAVIGAGLALNQFKKERAFDKRLEWHLQALGVIHDFEEEYTKFDFTSGERSQSFDQNQARFRRIMVESRAFMLPSRADEVLEAYDAHQRARWERLNREHLGIDAGTSRFAEERERLMDAERAVLEEVRRLVPDRLPGRWHFLRLLGRKYLPSAARRGRDS